MTSKTQKTELPDDLAAPDETGLGGARYLELFESLAPLVSCLDSAGVSMRSCQLIERLLGIEAWSIFLQSVDDPILRLAAATHIAQKDWPTISVQPGEGIIGQVFQSGQPLLISGREAFLRHMGREPDPRYPVPTCMIIPLSIRGKIAGVINVTNPTGPRVFRERDAQLVGSAALLIGGALTAASLYEESRRLQEGLEEIFDSMQIGALAVDQSEHVTHLNHRARHMFELPAENGDMKLADVLPDPLLRACRSMLTAENPDDKPSHEKLRATLRGVPVNVQLTVNPIRGVRETLGRQVVVIEDLTDQEEIVRLRAAESAKHSFMAIISHELRTPLTVIRGVLPMIDPGRVAQVQPQTLHQVHQLLARNCNRLGDVINSILDVTEIENETLRLVFRPTDLTELLKECIERLADNARAKRVSIETELCDLPIIEADARRIEQIIGEILNNAVKFSDSGAPVRVSTKIDSPWVEIRVTNTGAVIDDAQRENIFDKFRQCDGSNTRTVGGCGLGLFLARHLVRLHGGQIQLAECREKKTTFVVRLPLELPPEIRAWAEPEI
ncbi:GAF domain-containing protein [bacterium]|nr:GAF domain-containing protein [bacterium]